MDTTAKSNKRAKVGFILGLVSIIAWFLPIVGVPVTILAIVFSSLGLKSVERKGKAVAGLVLGIVFLIASLANGLLGAALGMAEYYETNPQNVEMSTSTTK